MTFTNVVVGIDGSAESDDALRWALGEARRRELPVQAVGVWYPSGTPEEVEALAEFRSVGELRSRLGDNLRSQVDGVVEAAGARDVVVNPRVVYGHPAEELIREAGEQSLLVVGSRGRGAIKASMLGSVSHSCAQSARGPVSVVRGLHERRPGKGRVVVGVDGSPGSVAALRFAHEDAARWGAELVVIHAWTLPFLTTTAPAWSVPVGAIDEAENQAGSTLRESLRQAAVDPDRSDVQPVLARGYPGQALLGAAENADLLVVGTRGAGGWKGLVLGSVSTLCLTHSPCPVVVTRDQPAS